MPTRRKVLTHSACLTHLVLGAGLLPLGAGAAQAQSVFEASAQVQIEGPDFAENGAVVPITLSTTLAGAVQLLLLVEQNPVPLIARFELSDALQSQFSIRTKMAQSSDVLAVAVMADGARYFAKMKINVIVGSCGE